MMALFCFFDMHLFSKAASVAILTILPLEKQSNPCQLLFALSTQSPNLADLKSPE
jgi:hypothetical protein